MIYVLSLALVVTGIAYVRLNRSTRRIINELMEGNTTLLNSHSALQRRYVEIKAQRDEAYGMMLSEELYTGIKEPKSKKKPTKKKAKR